MEAVTTLMKTSNFLYFYIACLVAGSILGMHRTVLIQGFMRMFVPLLAGTIAAVAAGILVGLLFGYSPYEAFFFIIVPIIAGGIGEGILPLSLAYSQILGQSTDVFVSQLIPAAIIGNVVAIISAGLMKKLGEKRPELNGNGRLVKSKKTMKFSTKRRGAENRLEINGCRRFNRMFLLHFRRFGLQVHRDSGSDPDDHRSGCRKICKASACKHGKGAHQLYKFMSSSFTWPLMVGLGILYIPLDDVASVISLRFIAVCASVVIAMVTSGYFVGKLMNMYPVESAIVTGCHSGLGGTGTWPFFRLQAGWV